MPGKKPEIQREDFFNMKSERQETTLIDLIDNWTISYLADSITSPHIANASFLVDFLINAKHYLKKNYDELSGSSLGITEFSLQIRQIVRRVFQSTDYRKVASQIETQILEQQFPDTCASRVDLDSIPTRDWVAETDYHELLLGLIRTLVVFIDPIIGLYASHAEVPFKFRENLDTVMKLFSAFQMEYHLSLLERKQQDKSTQHTSWEDAFYLGMSLERVRALAAMTDRELWSIHRQMISSTDRSERSKQREQFYGDACNLARRLWQAGSKMNHEQMARFLTSKWRKNQVEKSVQKTIRRQNSKVKTFAEFEEAAKQFHSLPYAPLKEKLLAIAPTEMICAPAKKD